VQRTFHWRTIRAAHARTQSIPLEIDMRSVKTSDWLPMPAKIMAERLAYAEAHPYPATRTAGPTCARCGSAVYARIIRKFGVPLYESICTGGHSEPLGRLRDDGYFSSVGR
jgi:hypothetical protein